MNSLHPFQVRTASLIALGISLAALSFTASASTTSPPSGAALWASTQDNILQLSTADASLKLDLDEIPEIHGLAVDPVSGELWVDSGGQLLGLDPTGKPLVTVPLPDAVADHDDDRAQANLAADGHAGNVWLATGHRLYRFDAKGTLQTVVDLKHDIRGLSLDGGRSRLWVALDDSLLVLDASGTKLFSVSLRHDPEALAYDTGLDQVWVTTDHHLLRYDAAGNPSFSTSLPHHADDFVAADGQGGAWVAGKDTLAYFNSAGTLAFSFRPFDDEGDHDDDEDDGRHIHALLADPTSHAAWIADRRHIREYATDSRLLQDVDTRAVLGEDDEHRKDDDGIRLALASTANPPTVSILSPANKADFNLGAFFMQSPGYPYPYLQLGFGSGADPSTLVVTANGQVNPLSCSVSADASSASCSGYVALDQITLQALHDRCQPFVITATVANRSGLLSKPASITITICPSF